MNFDFRAGEFFVHRCTGRTMACAPMPNGVLADYGQDSPVAFLHYSGTPRMALSMVCFFAHSGLLIFHGDRERVSQ